MIRAFPATFPREVATLLTGTGLAQVMTLAALPLLTRLYSPSDFGVLAFFVSGAMLTGMLVTGRYELAIPLPESDEEGSDVLRLATTLGLVASFVVGATLLILHGSLPRIARDRDLLSWTLWIPVSLVLTSLYQPLSYWFTRKSRFHALAVTRALQSGTASATQVALGLAGQVGPGALIAGALAGQAAATLALEIAARVRDRVPFRVGIARSRVWPLAKRHRGFPIFAAPASLLQIATDHLPLVLIPFLFGTALAGFYALPARILQACVVLLSVSTAQAFYPRAAREHRAGSLAQRCVEVHRSLVTWTVAPVLIVALGAPDLFETCFGEGWSTSGRYFRLLVPWFLGVIPIVPLSQVFLVLGRPQDALRFHAILLLASLATLLYGATWLAPDRAILVFSLTGMLVRLAGIEWILRLAGASPLIGPRFLGREVLRALPFLATLAAARAIGAGPRAVLGLAAVMIIAHGTMRMRENRAQGVPA